MYYQIFNIVIFFFTRWPSSIKTEKSSWGSKCPLISIFPFHEMLWLQLCTLVFQNIFLLPEHPWKKALKCSWVSLYYLQFWCLSPVLTHNFAWKFPVVVQTHTVSLKQQCTRGTLSSLFHGYSSTCLKKPNTPVHLFQVSVGSQHFDPNLVPLFQRQAPLNECLHRTRCIENLTHSSNSGKSMSILVFSIIIITNSHNNNNNRKHGVVLKV